jgi:hypothetical protein
MIGKDSDVRRVVRSLTIATVGGHGDLDTPLRRGKTRPSAAWKRIPVIVAKGLPRHVRQGQSPFACSILTMSCNMDGDCRRDRRSVAVPPWLAARFTPRRNLILARDAFAAARSWRTNVSAGIRVPSDCYNQKQ